MLSQFNIDLPMMFNKKLKEDIKKYKIINNVNMIRMGEFDIFTVGNSTSKHCRICNINNKWTYSVVDPNVFDENAKELTRVYE